MPDNGTPPDFSSFPGITDFEAQELKQVFQSVTAECPPPVTQFAIPTEGLKELHNFVCSFMRGLGTPQWIARFIAGIAILPLLVLNLVLSAFITILAPLVSAFAQEGLGIIDVFRKQIDPTVAAVSTSVLNELLGTDFTPEQLPTGIDVGSHIARAGAIGQLFFNTLTKEIATSADLEHIDGMAGAAHFAGMIINFGVATALLGLTGEIATLGVIKDFRLIGEQVSSGLGLSRQMRLVIK